MPTPCSRRPLTITASGLPDPYSPLLALAMLLAAAAALDIGLQATRRTTWRPRRCQTALALAVLLVIAACVVHWLSGHHAGSPEPMRGLGFVRHHPAPFVSLVVIAALTVATLRPGGGA